MPVALTPPKVMLVARRGEPWLLGSYGRALERLGSDVRYWDEQAALGRAVRLGSIGRRFNSFLPIAPWEARANREFVVAMRNQRPDAIVIAGCARVDAGALAQVRASLPDARLVLVWPDTLINLRQPTLAMLPLFDLVATYSEGSIDSFQKLGARRVRWIPFAADPYLYPADVSITGEQERRLACDVAFIGSPRPERERAVHALLERGVDVKVWGGTTGCAIRPIAHAPVATGKAHRCSEKTSFGRIAALVWLLTSSTTPIIRRPICDSSRQWRAARHRSCRAVPRWKPSSPKERG